MHRLRQAASFQAVCSTIAHELTPYGAVGADSCVSACFGILPGSVKASHSASSTLLDRVRFVVVAYSSVLCSKHELVSALLSQ